MKNIIDYAQTELQTWRERPFGSVDSLILSKLSYLCFDGVVPGFREEAEGIRLAELLRAELFPKMFETVLDAEASKKLLFALAASPRFRDVRMQYYVNELDPGMEKQFSAVTFLLDEENAYLAFRGTDATFIGWKEDFNMAFISPIPSQAAALAYLREVAKRWKSGLIVGGHSKGGNLAVYSSMRCEREISDRIKAIYSHDGPGFKENVFENEAYKNISGRIEKTLPQSSLIGMLLETQERYTVVESDAMGGIMQHNPLSWAVVGTDFCRLSQLNAGAETLNKTLNGWLKTLTDEKRELFVDSLYEIVSAAGVQSFSALSLDWQKKLLAMLSAAKNLDSETRRFLKETAMELVKLSMKNMLRPHMRQEEAAEMAEKDQEKRFKNSQTKRLPVDRTEN